MKSHIDAMRLLKENKSLSESLKDSRTIDKPYESDVLKGVKFANPELNTGKKSVDMKQTDHKTSDSIKELTSTEFKNPEKNIGKLREVIKSVKESLQDDKTIEDPHYSDAVKELTSVKFADPEKNVGKLKENKNLKEGIESTLDDIANKVSELGYEVMDDDRDGEGKTILIYKPESTENDKFDDFDNSELYDYLATISNVRYQVDNQDPSTLAIWIKELDEKKLTELRHVDKIVTVIGYDFSELEKGTQDMLIQKYYRNNPKASKPKSLKEMVSDELEEKLVNEVKEKYGFKLRMYKEDFENDKFGSIMIESRDFDPSVLSKNLESEYYGKENSNSIGEIYGYLGDDGYSSVETKIKERLSQYSNYTELPKAEKREILKKISEMVEGIRGLVTKAREEYKKQLNEYGSASINDYDKIQNKKAIDELSKYWYDKNGNKIVSKDKAKVVDMPKEEAKKLTEAPVGLEFDQGYDVYSYDDLDDWAKNNVFNNSDRARRNLYDKNLSILTDRVKSTVAEEVKKIGLEVEPGDKGIEVMSWDKGEISRVSIKLTTDSVIKYAKENGIELGDKKPTVHLSVYKGRNYTGWNMEYFIDGLSEEYKQSQEEKQLEEELKLDFEGLPRKVSRLVKQYEKEQDDELRNKFSTDRKYKRREYDSRGNIHKED